MKTIKRIAEVGERIFIVNALSFGTYENGAMFTVKEVEEGNKHIYVNEHGVRVYHYEYEVIVEATDDIEARYAQAVEQAREAIEELRLAALAKGYEDARRELTAVEPTPPVTAGELMKHCREGEQMTPQQKRDAIVERAKKEIEELKNTYDLYDVPDEADTKRPYNCNAEFIVNAEKRTVVVLTKGVDSGIIRAKGIAKCAPTDCFNAHIGKAISLRRALGLEVPADYYNAPQPTEVRAGDVVNGNDESGYYKPTKRFTITTVRFDRHYYAEDSSDYIYESQIGKIIDDTREGVDGK